MSKIAASVLMITAVTFEAITAALGKSLVGSIPVEDLLLVRYALAAAALTVFVDRSVLTVSWRLAAAHLVRAASMVAVLYLFLSALRTIDLATATALFFVYPIFTALASRWCFGVRFEPRFPLLVGGSLVGVVLILQPAATVEIRGMVLALLAALTVSIRSIADRTLGLAGLSPISISWVGSTIAFIMLTLADPRVPSIDHSLRLPVALFCLLAITASILIVAVTSRGAWQAFAVMGYWELVMAVLIAFLFFAIRPDALQILGCGLILASGVASAIDGRRSA